jgi:CheY-like chemotaxis protein
MSEGDELEEARGMPTILLAEDDVAQRLLYTRILIAAGYYVLSAENGDEAIETARRAHPGLVLMDVTMPGKDGWTVTRELKNDPATRDTPIIVMTGLTGAVEDGTVAASGCDDFMTKPIAVRALLTKVASFLPPGRHSTPI